MARNLAVKTNVHWFDAFPTHRLMISAAALGNEALLARCILFTFKELWLQFQAIDVMWPLRGVQQQVYWLHVAASESFSWIVWSCWPAWGQYESWPWPHPICCRKLETAITACQVWWAAAPLQCAWQWDATCISGECSNWRWIYATPPTKQNLSSYLLVDRVVLSSNQI